MAAIGRIPYLNCCLFFDRWGEDSSVLVDLPPRQLGEEAAAGRLDAGPMAVADVIRLEDRFEPLGNFGISCPQRAITVLLFSRVPMSELDGATIGITGETATSVRLLKVLLRHKYNVQPARYTSPDDANADAILLIGDTALRARYQQDSPWQYCIDLAEEWRAWQALPFVFARWIVRRELPQSDKDTLRTQLATAYAQGCEQRNAIAEARATRLGVPVQDVLDYLDEFRFELNEEDERAIERFRELLQETPDA